MVAYRTCPGGTCSVLETVRVRLPVDTETSSLACLGTIPRVRVEVLPEDQSDLGTTPHEAHVVFCLPDIGQ